MKTEPIELLEQCLRMMKDRRHDVAGLGGCISILDQVIILTRNDNDNYSILREALIRITAEVDNPELLKQIAMEAIKGTQTGRMTSL